LPAQDGDDFYDPSPPNFIQQGDIFPNVPLIEIPPSRQLVVLRTLGARGRLTDPSPGPVELVQEDAVDSFADGEREHIVVSALRGLGIVMTQTCDLEHIDLWMVCPGFSVDGSTVDAGNLFANNYPNLFGLPDQPDKYFDACYIQLSDIRQISRHSVRLADRIASLSQMKQQALQDKLGQMLQRVWGYAEGEEVQRAGKYKCHRCNLFIGIENPAIDLNAGDRFPRCQNCAKIHKSGQWYLLHTHKKY
jgi:hypothetical protein